MQLATIIILRELVGQSVIGDDPNHYKFPCYLKRYDPEAYGGRGAVDATHEIADALRFESKDAALRCCLQTPKAKPRRQDGKPNRPLMAFTMEIVEA
jgi:hypothetical protein